MLFVIIPLPHEHAPLNERHPMASNANIFNLLKIIAEIKTNPRQTPEQLYTSLGISKSGFYKYMRRLRTELDFDVRYSRKSACFIIENEPFLPTLNLEFDELSALVRSMGQFYASGGDYVTTYHALKAVRKFVALFPNQQIRRQLQDIFGETLYNEGYGCKEKILRIIEQAIEDHRILRIRYFSISEGRQELEHDIEPYMIYFKRRALYLDAHCRTHWGTIRMYRLNRVRQAAIVPDSSFEVRDDYSFKQRHQHAFLIYPGDTPVTVKIRFNQHKAPYIEEVCWHPSQKITPDPDHPGSIIFEVSVAYPKEVVWWMRRWCQDAEVLEPQEMRDYMLEIARQEVAMYERSIQPTKQIH